MSSNKGLGNKILAQGMILAIASMLSRVIGLVYRVPLTNIIRDTGNDYYGTAFTIYNIVLIVSSYSLPIAVSKIVSAKMAVNEVENARRSLVGALLFALTTGTIGMLIIWFGADALANMLKTPLSAPALRVLAPVILIVALVGVIRGFFQGLHTMVPSAISQIVEQIVNAIVSVVAAYYLFNYGLKAGALIGNKDKYAAAYGAAGGTLGTAAGAGVALIFMLFIFSIYKGVFNKKLRRSRAKRMPVDSYSTVFRILIFTIIPILLSTTIYNLFSFTEMFIFKNVTRLQGYDPHQISLWWGIYAGKVSVLTNIPIAIASALSASFMPAISASFKKGDKAEVRSLIVLSTRFISLLAFPCMVGFFVLAHPFLLMLFHDNSAEAATILMINCFCVPFYCLSTLSNGLLQGINKMMEPVKNAAIALLCHAVFLLFILEVFNSNIYGGMVAVIFYGVLMCIFNRVSLYKYTRIIPEFYKTYFLPLIASILMGVFVFISYKLIHIITASNPIATIISIFVGMITYFALIIKVGAINEKELQRVPKGDLIIRLAYKMRLFKERD